MAKECAPEKVNLRRSATSLFPILFLVKTFAAVFLASILQPIQETGEASMQLTIVTPCFHDRY